MARQTAADKAFLETARERFQLADDTDSAQSTRERDDLAFYAGEQWPADILKLRGAQPATGAIPGVPARPSLVINKVREPVRQIQNQERQSDMGVTLVPADDFGDLGITPDETEVTLREGLIRRIQRESNAADARTWAFSRAVICGRGYYLVTTQYLPGKTWDQEVVVQRIFNQAGVKLDPARTLPDGSDAEWGFVSTWTSWESYAATYPTLSDGSPNAMSYTESEFVSAHENYPDWFKYDGDGDNKRRYVRVTDYYYTERESKELAILPDGQTVWLDEVPDGVKPLETRRMVEKTMHWCKIGCGTQKLEETTLPSPEIPIIEVLGEELQPYDEQRRVEGAVRPSRDSQMGFNYSVSRYVEGVGLTTLTPITVDPVAIEGFEPMYAVANTRALPFLPYRTYDDSGRPLKEAHRPQGDLNTLALMQGIGLFDQAIKSTTAVPDPTLGNVDPTLKSGKAIRETVANAAQSTSHFIDNLARSVRREGQVVNSYLYAIYGTRPGRLVRMMTGDGEHQSMRIAPEPGQPDPQAQGPQQKAMKVAKLTKDAHFNVAVRVTRSFDTRREQLTTMLGQIISADPNQMLVAGDILYKNMDIPEAAQLSDRMKLMLAPPIQKFLAEESQGEPVPPAAQAEIAQLQQRVQMAEQAMQQLTGEADKNRADGQVKIQIAWQGNQKDVEIERLRGQIEQSKIAADLEKARMDNATKMYVADVQAKTQGVQILHEAEHEAMALAHEAAEADLDRLQAQQSEVSGMAHEAALGEGDQAFQASESALGRLSLDDGASG